jgi:protein-tyrosine phosphatase
MQARKQTKSAEQVITMKTIASYAMNTPANSPKSLNDKPIQRAIINCMSSSPTQKQTEFAVLFVCMGNICRSPTAEGVFAHMLREAGLAERVRVDSAGTHNYHPGSPPDERSQQHALHRGYNLSSLRARRVQAEDYERFDLLLAMDWDNLALLEDDCPPEHARKLRRLMEFAQVSSHTVVPDPYHGGDQGFEDVLDLVEQACIGLLSHVRHRLMTA